MLALERLAGGGLDAGDDLVRRRADFNVSVWMAESDPLDVPTEDLTLTGALHPYPVRVYAPVGATAGLVFFHGGGWVCGDLESHDVLCRRLALGSNRIVIAVHYPRAPEVSWPGACHMAADAWRTAHSWLLQRYPTLPHVALGGDSAGGNLTAVAVRLLREEGPLPDLQVLLYPALDATLTQGSFFELGAGYILTATNIHWYLGQYGPDAQHPLGSPGLAPDLEGLPAALVVVAGFDPLRDEGLAYAERLRDAGIATELVDCPSMLHGFLNMAGLSDRAGALIDDVATRLRYRG